MRTLFVKFTIAVVLLCLFCSAISRGNDAEFRILKQDGQEILLEWQAPPLHWKELQTERSNFLVPEMGDLVLSQVPGFPMLPVASFAFSDPRTRLQVVILDSVITTHSIPSICPAPFWRYDSAKTLLEPEYSYATEYDPSWNYPASWAEWSWVKSRDEVLHRLAIRPVRYHMESRSCQVLNYIRLAIRYETQQTAGISTTIGKDAGRHAAQTDRWSAPTLHAEKPFKVKLLLTQEGVYRVSGQDLSDAGVAISQIDLRTLQVFHRGEELPCEIRSASGQSLSMSPDDQILFYGERLAGETEYHHAYTDTNVYWLTWGGQAGLRYAPTPSPPLIDPIVAVDAASALLHLERDLDYYNGDTDADIHETEQVFGEGWVWNKFINPGNRMRIDFDLPALFPIQDSVRVRLRIKGTTLAKQTPDHHVRIHLNGTVVHDLYFNDREEKILDFKVLKRLLGSTANVLEIESVNDTQADRSQFYFDWVEFHYQKNLHAQNHWLEFGALDTATPLGFFLSGFTSSDITIWDRHRRQLLTPSQIGKNWLARVQVSSAGLADGNFARFHINGEQVFSGGRGINVVVLDSLSGAVSRKEHFDTYASQTESNNLAALINSLANGTYVLAGISDEGVTNLSENARLALETLGSAKIRDLSYRDSWALIGKKGAAKGTVPEMHTRSGSGAAEAFLSIYFREGSYHSAFFSPTNRETSHWIAFEPAAWKRPLRIVLDHSSNWRSIEHGADYLIVTHSTFQKQAERLAKHRQDRHGLRSKVILIQDIYDEFGHGIVHPWAIRDFLEFAYRNWTKPVPRYVLLLGDGSWDPKKNLADATKTDFIPVVGNPVSDLLYVCFDGAGDIMPEMDIGRIPVETAEQAQAVIDKIVAYEGTPTAAWKKHFVFISGGFDKIEQSAFNQQSARLANDFVRKPPMGGRVTYIRKESVGYTEGEHRQDILDAFNNGAVWFNFIGHAGSRTWDLMFHNPDIDVLQNSPYFPFITSMTCHTGRFAEPNQTSFGEHFLVVTDRGAVAFLGTTGWGYTYEDYMFLRNLYPLALQDTLHQVGSVINKAKIALWQTFGGNKQVRDLVLQYDLLGDPAMKLSLPTQPDLALTPSSVEMTPLLPSEADSVAQVHVRVENYGLVPPDSITVLLQIQPENGVVTEITRTIAPISLSDTTVFRWHLKGMAGSVTLRVVVDPMNAIAEIDESNNSQTVQVTVLSSRLLALTPPRSGFVPVGEVNLKILNPAQTIIGQTFFEFELDTIGSFNSQFLKRSGPIAAGVLATSWKPQNLSLGHYFWRCRDAAEDQTEAWIQSEFSITPDQRFGWRQIFSQSYAQNQLIDLAQDGKSVVLGRQTLALYVESAGFNDGNYARIIINSKALIQPGRGHNLVALDSRTGAVLVIKKFDTYGDAHAADSLAQVIAELPDSAVVMVAIKDEGTAAMKESGYLALEAIGSALCRNVAGRESWAIIGRKGAAKGSVPEKWTRLGEGNVALEDTLRLYALEGTLRSAQIGPARRWHSVSWQSQTPSATELSLAVLGLNKSTKNLDTLRHDLRNTTGVLLQGIDPLTYPTLFLTARFITTDGYKTPRLLSWEVSYEPVPDLAVSQAVVKQNKDTLLVGETLELRLNVHNLGMAPVDSFRVLYQESNPALGRIVFAEKVIRKPLPADSSVEILQTWSSVGKTGLQRFYLNVDAADLVNELDENNNNVVAQAFVKADSVDPEIRITFDGREIIENDLVSSQPLILVKIFDNSPQAIGDTLAVNVFLDGIRLHYDQNERVIKLMPGLRNGQVAEVEITPSLQDGDHFLELLVRDASGNLKHQRVDFRVISQLKLQHVMNYPNPFTDQTDITFVLTQPADVTIKFFTVAGRLIRTLSPGWCAAGFHAVRFDGLDADQEMPANGVYLYKILASDGNDRVEEIGKMILMR